MDGVARFSGGFRDEPWPRLIRTGHVRGHAHLRHPHRGPSGRRRGCAASTARLGGTEETTGRAYRVDDPDLLLWVHCCEVDSLLSVARRAGRAADRRRRRPVRRRAGDRRRELIGVPAGGRPRLGRRARRLLRGGSGPTLAVTPAARDAYRLIVLPPMPTWVRYLTPAQPAWGGLASLGRGPAAAVGPADVLAAGARAHRRRGDGGAQGLPAGDAAAPPAGPPLADRLGRVRAGRRRHRRPEPLRPSGVVLGEEAPGLPRRAAA